MEKTKSNDCAIDLYLIKMMPKTSLIFIDDQNMSLSQCMTEFISVRRLYSQVMQ